MAAARDSRVAAHRPLSQDQEREARSPAARCVSGTILFDGVCNLCNGFVRFVIQRDPHARFRFAALSSDAARQVLKDAGVQASIPDSIVLIQEGRVYFRSD